jgi:hypothetical protein
LSSARRTDTKANPMKRQIVRIIIAFFEPGTVNPQRPILNNPPPFFV